jgi:hypothetical protein
MPPSQARIGTEFLRDKELSNFSARRNPTEAERSKRRD